MKRSVAVLSLIIVLSGLSANAQSKVLPYDTLEQHLINFDDTINIQYVCLDTTTQNLWHIGSPQKAIFSSALSAPKVIVTDTLNHYPVNNHSVFDLYVGNFNLSSYPYEICIDFWHKYDTDTLKDGGYITVSWDNGLSWMNIISDTVYTDVGIIPAYYDFFNLNIYSPFDSLFNGTNGFSGSSDGWIHTFIMWQYMVAKEKLFTEPDTMIVRFNFISDNVDSSREGWMIDNLRVLYIELPPGGIENLQKNSDPVRTFPNPTATTFSFQLPSNFGVLEQLEIFSGVGQLMGIYKNTENIDISGYPSGLYFLVVTGESGDRITGKVVKE